MESSASRSPSGSGASNVQTDGSTDGQPDNMQVDEVTVGQSNDVRTDGSTNGRANRVRNDVVTNQQNNGLQFGLDTHGEENNGLVRHDADRQENNQQNSLDLQRRSTDNGHDVYETDSQPKAIAMILQIAEQQKASRGIRTFCIQVITVNFTHEAFYLVKPTTLMRRLIQSYCTTAKFKPEDIRFLHRDRRVIETDTPNSLGITGNDIFIVAMHCRFKQKQKFCNCVKYRKQLNLKPVE